MKESIFIWIPKNAGTSIYGTIADPKYPVLKHKRDYEWFRVVGFKFCSIGHVDFKEIIKEGWLDKGFLNKAFKFAFVRNPYTRILSLYAHIGISYGCKTLEDFLQCIKKGILPIGLYNEKSLSQCNPQYHWLYDDDNLIVDFVGRFERLQEDFDIVCDKIGLKRRGIAHDNKRSRFQREKLGYVIEHTPETIKLTKEIYKKDFELFGYEMEENKT